MDSRKLVEFEGSGGDLTELIGEGATEFQLMLVLLVRTMYRPARALLKGEEKERGLRWMQGFRDANLVLAGVARRAGDLLLSLLARHNAASACYWLGTGALQNKENRVILEALLALPGSPDAEFVYSKAFFGLLENDSLFAADIDLDEWMALVKRMGRNRYPDYPGRALALARKLAELERTRKAIHFLNEAVQATDFGKKVQVEEAEIYLAELRAQLVRSKTGGDE